MPAMPLASCEICSVCSPLRIYWMYSTESRRGNLMRMTSLCSAVLLTATVGISTVHAASDSAKATMLVARTQVLSLQLAAVANDAAGGNVDAFKSLKILSETIATNAAHLGAYADRDLAAASAQLIADAAKLLDSQQKILATADAVADVDARLPVLNSRIDEIGKILVERGDSAKHVMLVYRQMALTDRMQRRIQSVLRGGEESPSAAAGLQRDALFYGAMLTGLIKGNKDLDIKPIANASALAILNDVDAQWTALVPTITKLLEAAPDLQEARQAVDKSVVDAQTLILRSETLMSRINE
jgi:twitching motility protein PilJ